MMQSETKTKAFRQSRNLSKNSKQNRETSWNPRFYIEKMPEYDAFKDKYLKDLQPTFKPKKPIITAKARKVKIRSPKSIKKINSNKKIVSAQAQIHGLQVLSKLKQETENLYISKGISNELFKTLIACTEVLDIQQSISLLNKHIQSVSSDSSAVQTALKEVKHRERLLKQIEELVIDSNIERKEAAEYISNLSIYSIQAVESILEWKKEMAEWDPSLFKQSFLYHTEDYLAKMTRDTYFIKESKIAVLLGEKNFEGLIPSFCEKKFKNFIKRHANAEDALLEEVPPSAKESIFELKNRKSEKKIGKEEIDYSKIESHDLCIAEFPEEVLQDIEEYSKQVPDQIKSCLGDPVHAYNTSLALKFPSFLLVKYKESVLGLLILNLENQKTMQKRLFITHISSVHLQILEKVICQSVEFCKLNYPCDEIRVALSSPQNAEGKYESDKSIKQYFDKLGFRWKVLIKDRTDFPVHILGLSIPKSNNSENKEIFQDSLRFSYSCTGQFVDNKADPEPTFSDIGVSVLLKSISFKSYPNESVSNIISKVDQNWAPDAFKVLSLDLKQAKEETEKIGLKIGNLEDKETHLSLSSIELNWVKFLTTIWKNTKFIYVYGCEIEVMSSDQNLVYIIPTEDPNFNSFLIPHPDKVKDPLKQSKEILSGITSIKEKINKIWIPEFRISGSKKNTLASESDCLTVEETFCVHVKAAMHKQGNIKLTPKENEVVICDSFLFGLVNSKIDEELEVPYFASFITPANFLAG